MKCFGCVAVLSILLVLGCSKPQIIPVPCPEPPVITEPAYRTDNLGKDPSMESLVTALTMDFIETRAALHKALTILDGYRKAQPTTQPAQTSQPQAKAQETKK